MPRVKPWASFWGLGLAARAQACPERSEGRSQWLPHWPELFLFDSAVVCLRFQSRIFRVVPGLGQ
jgi:hypothetical protein